MSWGYAVQAGMTVAGRIFGGMSAEKARKKAQAQADKALLAAGKKGAKVRKRVTKAIDKAADRAEHRMENLSNRYDRQSKALADRTIKLSSAAATAERETVMADEATRFVRLREAADAGGFNPLTVLASGFTGAALPTGILSADQHITMMGMKSDQLATGYSTRMALDGQIQGQRIDGVNVAYGHGLNANQMTYDSIMKGHEYAAGQANEAYDRTANMFSDLGNVAASAYEGRVAQDQFDRAHQLDLERLDLDREQFSFERDYNERMAAIAAASGRSPGAGSARLASYTAGGSISDTPPDHLHQGDYSLGLPSDVDGSGAFTEALGDTGGDGVKTMTMMPEVIEGVENAFQRWGTVIMDGFRTGSTPAGAAWRRSVDNWNNAAAIRQRVRDEYEFEGQWLGDRANGTTGPYQNWGGL